MTLISKEKRILALPGDVFGIHYARGARDGIVPYDTSDAPLCCGVNSSDLSPYHNSALWDDQLPVGAVINTVTTTLKRLPALKPLLGGKLFYCSVHVAIINVCWTLRNLLGVINLTCCGATKTSSNGNIFRVTGLLCREFTGPTKASDAEL